jgi:hypothetical protein
MPICRIEKAIRYKHAINPKEILAVRHQYRRELISKPCME